MPALIFVGTYTALIKGHGVVVHQQQIIRKGRPLAIGDEVQPMICCPGSWIRLSDFPQPKDTQ